MGAAHMNTDHQEEAAFGLEKKSRLLKAYRADRLGRIAMACFKPPLSLQTEEIRKGDSLDLSLPCLSTARISVGKMVQS